MLAELTVEELTTGLDQVAEGVLAEANIDAPPVDAFAVARALGIVVAWDDRQGGRARYVRLNHNVPASRQAAILLRPDPRGERRQWAVAHEIGEHVAHRVFALWDADPRCLSPNARERVANQVANRLLLPSCWFVADCQACSFDLFALKGCYRTASHELIARRMLDLEPPMVLTIFDQGRISLRRGNLSGRVPPIAPHERQCWQAVRNSGKPQHLTEALSIVHGWPIHETDWCREILRTEITSWEADF